MCERDRWEQVAKLRECDAAAGAGACECIGGVGVSVMLIWLAQLPTIAGMAFKRLNCLGKKAAAND